MNARYLLLAAILVLVGAAVWLVSDPLAVADDGNGPEALSAGEPLSLSPGDDPQTPVDLTPLAPDAAVAGVERSVAALATEDVQPVEGVAGGFWRAPRGSVWVGGRIELPPGTPLDERLVIVAKGATFTNRSDGGKEMRVVADENGEFRVAFAKATRVGRLYLEGRYL